MADGSQPLGGTERPEHERADDRSEQDRARHRRSPSVDQPENHGAENRLRHGDRGQHLPRLTEPDRDIGPADQGGQGEPKVRDCAGTLGGPAPKVYGVPGTAPRARSAARAPSPARARGPR